MSSVTNLTYGGIWLAVFGRQLCLPVPAILFLMTAGALAANGRLHVSFVLLAGVAGCLAGDGVWFWLGRKWGTKVVRMVCRLSTNPRACSQRAQRVFSEWGLRILILAKFIPGLDGVTPPLAGAEGSPILSFLAYDSIGSLLWSAAYVTVGFLFADELDVAIRGAERFGSLVGMAIGIPFLCYVCWRGLAIIRMIGRLRLRRMSPALLNRRLQNGDRIAVIDLLEFEDGEENAEGIPGAVRVNPASLRVAQTVYVPRDVEMVLYCSSQAQLLSARVALALERRGIANVWVLDGGLSAWRALGLPLTARLDSAEQVASRLGIELPSNHLVS